MSDDVKNFAKEISEAQGDRLIQAAGTGDLQTVTALLDAGMDPNWHRKNSAETALLAASQAGHIEVVRFLLNHGAEVDHNMEIISTPLAAASQARQWDAAKLLLEHGADPLHINGIDYETSAWTAASAGEEAVVVSMIEMAKDDASRNQIIQEVLFGASFSGDLGLIRFALDRGADVHGEDEWGDTALSWAVNVGNTSAVELLVDAGSDIRHQNPSCGESGTRLRDDLTSLVIQCFSTVFAPKDRGWEGCTLLMLTHSPEIAEFLLSRGVDVDARDHDGWTALMHSARWGNVEVMRVIFDHGADVDVRDHRGRTAFTHSAWYGDVEVMRLLLDHGADVNMQCSDDNWTPLMIACESNMIGLEERERGQPLTDHLKLLEVVKLLVERGADVNKADARGATAIRYALKYEYLNVVEFLIENGARTDSSEYFEERLRQAAREFQRPRLAELLKKSKE